MPECLSPAKLPTQVQVCNRRLLTPTKGLTLRAALFAGGLDSGGPIRTPNAKLIWRRTSQPMTIASIPQTGEATVAPDELWGKCPCSEMLWKPIHGPRVVGFSGVCTDAVGAMPKGSILTLQALCSTSEGGQ